MHYEQSEVEGGKVHPCVHTFTVAPFTTKYKRERVKACNTRSRSPPYFKGGAPGGEQD